MLTVHTHKKFDKDLRRLKKRGYNLGKLEEVVILLEQEKKLPRKYKDHPLKGNYVGFRDCHIEPDWLLIYRVSKSSLFLSSTGTHSDLFKS